MDKKKVQEAIKQIDDALAQIASNRQGHAALANSIQLVSRCCETYFIGKEPNLIPIRPEEKHVRADEPTERPEPCDKDK